MSQELEGLFERIEGELEAKLAARGYAKTKRGHHPQAFGNRYVVFERPGGHVRFTWDGRLRSLILRVYRKRNRVWGAVLLSLLGKYDSDKLEREIVVRENDIRSAGEEEIVSRFTDRM
jgi:hypothetical protein